MTTLDSYALEKLTVIETRGQTRRTLPMVRDAAGGVTRDATRVLSFSCNDYLNLSLHPDVKARAKAAIDDFGAGSGASRLVTGNYPLLDELEQRLAQVKGTEAACVFGSGFLANVGIIPCFAGAEDVIFMDELSHACIYTGAKLSTAPIHIFRHNDMDHLNALLTAERSKHRHALIVTDGVFSMDGDVAPLDELGPLAMAHDAWLMTDDAHGVGVVGAGGRGSSFMGKEKAMVPLQMGTLSKALGSYGGYLCASRVVIDYVKNRARSLIFTTGLPPASAAAALAALDIIDRDPVFRTEPVRKARLFATALNLPEPVTPIVPVIVGDSTAAMEASAKLYERGFLVTAIRPPTVAEGTARLRVTFTANHQDADVLALAATMRDLGIVKR